MCATEEQEPRSPLQGIVLQGSSQVCSEGAGVEERRSNGLLRSGGGKQQRASEERTGGARWSGRVGAELPNRVAGGFRGSIAGVFSGVQRRSRSGLEVQAGAEEWEPNRRVALQGVSGDRLQGSSQVCS